MLQRSPSYVVSVPSEDPLAARLGRLLPARAAYATTRWKNIVVAGAVYRLSRRRPGLLRWLIRKATAAAVPGVDVDTHFNPRYDPWDQRLCLAPDGDLFRALRRGTAEVVTDTIETFTPTGIRLRSGAGLDADAVVMATGLKLKPFGGIRLVVDGDEVKLPHTMAYRALMLSGVPNFAFTIGYTNASWTLKADLVGDYVCRLLSHLQEHGLREVVPVRDESPVGGAVPRLQGRLRPAGARPAPGPGPAGAVEAAAELRPRPAPDQVRADRRRRARLPLIFAAAK